MIMWMNGQLSVINDDGYLHALPFDRVPTCACDPGRGDPPTKLQRLECKMRGGPCSPNRYEQAKL